MNVTSYRFDFRQLGITADTISKFMGYEEGPPPEPFGELIHEVLSVAENYCDIQGGYTIPENVKLDKSNKKLLVGDITFDIHRTITNQLNKSEQFAFFVCTAGAGIGEWSKKLMKEGDMIKGYVVDVVGSETVEAAMDLVQGNLEDEIQKKGMFITDRYSPGYCDWHLSEQRKLFSFFPDRYCNITLSPSSLMYPIKSVSGIIGIGKNVKKKGYICNLCDMTNCIYRNKRVQTSC